jgi:hypothetical protein
MLITMNFIPSSAALTAHNHYKKARGISSNTLLFNRSAYLTYNKHLGNLRVSIPTALLSTDYICLCRLVQESYGVSGLVLLTQTPTAVFDNN